jgi:hypothetical protein
MVASNQSHEVAAAIRALKRMDQGLHQLAARLEGKTFYSHADLSTVWAAYKEKVEQRKQERAQQRARARESAKRHKEEKRRHDQQWWDLLHSEKNKQAWEAGYDYGYCDHAYLSFYYDVVNPRIAELLRERGIEPTHRAAAFWHRGQRNGFAARVPRKPKRGRKFPWRTPTIEEVRP